MARPTAKGILMSHNAEDIPEILRGLSDVALRRLRDEASGEACMAREDIQDAQDRADIYDVFHVLVQRELGEGSLDQIAFGDAPGSDRC